MTNRACLTFYRHVKRKFTASLLCRATLCADFTWQTLNQLSVGRGTCTWKRLMKLKHSQRCTTIFAHLWLFICRQNDAPAANSNSSTADRYTCFLCSPVLDRGAQSGSGVHPPFGPRGYRLQHHHLGLVEETPAVVHSDMEPSFLDDNCPRCALWSWLFLTITEKYSGVNSWFHPPPPLICLHHAAN